MASDSVHHDHEAEVPLLSESRSTSPPAGDKVEKLAKTRRRVILGGLACFVIACLCAGGVYAFRLYRSRPVSGLAVGKHGAVATELKECSDVGIDILKKGGNAMDAGIAAALCIGAINSFSSGIGGGGFLVYRPADTSIPPKVINFRESAPAAARKNMYAGNEMLAQKGGLSVSVPGEIRGYEVAHQMFGKLSWRELFEPSIEIARHGIECPDELAARLQVYGQTFPDDPDWAPIFAPEGKLLNPGDRLVRSKFADTLEKISHNGSEVFYNGEIAQSIVKHVQSHGGILTMEDMRDYEARVEDPVRSTYRDDFEVISCGSPSSGPVLIQGLNILETFNMSKIGNGALGHHYLIEAMKYLSAGRTELGDPYYLKTADLRRIEELQDKAYAAECAHNISSSRTYDFDHYNPKYEFGLNHGTTSLSAIDSEGNAVAITTTVNLIFGSGLLDPETGIILNDEQDDFSIPGVSNAFGLRPSVFNYVRAGKRSMSSQTPTIVTQDGEIRLSLGGSGGSRIVTAILDALVKRLDWHYSLAQTVRSPRVHHQLLPNIVSAESTVAQDVMDGLTSRGHAVETYPMGSPRSEIQAVEWYDGHIYGMSDPRKRGAASAY